MASQTIHSPLAAAWNRAATDHQAGRLAQAESGYRQVLALSPQHVEAGHMLGVVLMQLGRLEEAQRLIAEVIATHPKHAVAHGNLGNVHLRSGRKAMAQTCFEKAIALQPSYADAHFNLANLLHEAGRHADAAKHFQRAIAGNPKWYQAQLNLGACCLKLGDAQQAARHFEQALRLKPSSASAASNLGAALAEAGDLTRALQALNQAVQLDPASVSALTNQGGVLARLGRTAAARQALDRAIALAPDDAAAHLNMALLLRDDPAAALPFFERAARLDASLVEARAGLALVLHQLGRTEEAQKAQAALQQQHAGSADALLLQARLAVDRRDTAAALDALARAAQADPRNAEVHHQHGNQLMAGGRWREAMAAWQRARDLDPSHARARWALAMGQVAPVAESAQAVVSGRGALARSLTELEKLFEGANAALGATAVGSTQPFYLAYEAVNQRELLQRYGRLCARSMASWQTEQGLVPAASAPHRPVRVGIVSAQLRDHSVWNAVIKGWVRHLDRSQFHLVLYDLGQVADAQTQEARRLAHAYVSGPRDLAGWARQILADGIDVLIYPEIGMDPLTTRLASLRLAPSQAAAWGHPITSGLPTIDHYLSAEDLEPPDARNHYSEKLVALPHLGVAVAPTAVTPIAPDLAALGLPADRLLLLCPGVPFKYAPAQDRVWAQIAQRLPQAQLVFFQPPGSELGTQLEKRLAAHFDKAGLRLAAHASFIPFLDLPRFFGLMHRAHLFLDTIGFSGFNTALQAVECGLPVVTQEGAFLRGRLASGILRRLGLDEAVVADDDAYIDAVVRLTTDPAARHALSARMVDQRAMLFNDTAPVRALEAFLRDPAGAA